jgi:hypothetical protein
VVDRDGLENRCAREGTVGSNPTLSAIAADNDICYQYLMYMDRAPLQHFENAVDRSVTATESGADRENAIGPVVLGGGCLE